MTRYENLRRGRTPGADTRRADYNRRDAGMVQPLAKTRRVIAVEMQGHGRTADTDRPMSFTTLGDDSEPDSSNGGT